MTRAKRAADPGEPAPPGTLFPRDREVHSLDGTPIRYTVRGRDPRTPPALAEQMAAAMPDAELHVIDRASHALPIEEPEALDDLVLSWLARRIPTRARAAHTRTAGGGAAG